MKLQKSKYSVISNNVHKEENKATKYFQHQTMNIVRLKGINKLSCT